MRQRLAALALLLMPGVVVAEKPVVVKPVEHWPLWRHDAASTGVVATRLPEELKERWVFKCKDTVEGAPAIIGDLAYIASMDKHLYAVNLKTGAQIWKKKLGIMKASPIFNRGRIIVGDIEGKVHCVDAKTGENVWLFDNESGEIASGCNVYGDSILVAAQGMPVICLDQAGRKAWIHEIDGGSNGTPSITGDVCFASGCDSHFHALDAKTGTEIWKLELPGQAAATTCVHGDVAYVGTVTHQVVAIDLKSRQKLWQFEAAKKGQPFYSSAAVSEGLVILGSRDRKVYALDAKTGEEKWSFVTEGSVDASPAIAGSRVYVGCQSLTGEFYVLDLKTGKQLQELTLDSPVTGSASLGADCVLVGSEKGSVYCFGK